MKFSNNAKDLVIFSLTIKSEIVTTGKIIQLTELIEIPGISPTPLARQYKGSNLTDLIQRECLDLLNQLTQLARMMHYQFWKMVK